jgi:tetratricopeptide (TPR) repeat protein
MELKDLKALLDHPNQLQLELEKLRSDARLSEEIKGFIVLYDSFEGDCENIKNYLSTTEKQILAPSQPKTIPFSILKYAAGFALLIGLGGFLYYYSTTNSATNLSSKNAKKKDVFTEPGIPIFMGENPKIEWGSLMFAIEEESTEKAITEWQKIQKLAPENDTVLYFGGIVYFNDNQIQKAEKFFKRNRQIQSSYNDRSLYFIAIIDWKRNRRAEAKKKLLQLSSTSDEALKKAVKIHLKDIDYDSQNR